MTIARRPRIIARAATVACFVLAAPTAGAALRVEIEAAPTYAWLLRNYDHDLSKLYGRPSFAVGTHVEFRPSPRVGLQTGLRFERFGDRLKVSDPAFFGPWQNRLTASYVLVPARLTVRPAASRWYVALGPEAGWLAAARGEREFSFPAPFYLQSGSFYDARSSLRRWTLVGSAEGGVDLDIGPQKVRVGLRFSRGLTPSNPGGSWVSNWHIQSLEGVLGLVW